MTFQRKNSEGFDGVVITLTLDELRCLKHTAQKAWMWKRFWLLAKWIVG